MQTKQQQWKKTVAAAMAEESSAWSMIWAMAEEAFERDPTYKNITSGPVIHEIQKELDAVGVTMSFDTIKWRALVGKFAHSAKTSDSDTLRSVPWSVVRAPAGSGATPEAAANLIRKCRTDGIQPTEAVMREAFRSRSTTGASSSPQPKFTDDGYMSLIADLAAYTMAERRGEYTPGAMARLAASLFGEMLVGKVAVVDWDAQLAELVDAQGGA